jgi:hypothetical protein
MVESSLRITKKHLALRCSEFLENVFGSAGSANVLTSGSIGGGNSEVFVNIPDFTQFKNTFGSESDLPGGPSQPTYNVAMDANLDGMLDAIDYAKFKHNFGAAWSF